VSRAPLVLASRSPQRRAILTQLGLPFRVAEPGYHEAPLDLPPELVVEERSRGKARSVAQRAGDGPVLGVDTEVVLDDGTVLGQPPDAAAARAMLAALSGRTHRVLSGLTVRDGDVERTAHAATAVTFRALADDELDAYVARGEWRGRAGGYAIQEAGAVLVARVEGDYANVVGLPVALLVESLHGVGYPALL
jgi:septum formation protein